MNKVILIGNLTRDPEVKSIPSGISCVNFTVACQRKYVNQQGVREADFINCVAWRQTADFVSKYFTKGSKIVLEGTIQTRTYDAQDGTKRHVTEVIVDSVEFGGSKGDSASHNENNTYNDTQTAPIDTTPPITTNPEFTEVDDSELPF